MKRQYYYFILCLFLSLSCSTDSVGPDSEDETLNNVVQEPATTNIADMAFEQALIDLNFDEALDGKVLNSRIETITNLILDDKEITDLTGILNFRDLENLSVRNNDLRAINVSENKKLKFLWFEDNNISTLDVDGLALLEKVGADRNSLANIDVSSNTALQLLTLSENNLTAINVSTNTALTDFTVTDNPLDCIQVNQMQLDNIPTDWSKDETDGYSLDCQ